MKIASFGHFRVGIVDGDAIADVTGALPAALDQLPYQRVNWLIAHWTEGGRDLVQGALARAERVALASVKLIAPNPSPRHVFAAPANYRRHIGELGSRAVTDTRRTAREQGVFLKATGSLSGAGEPLELPHAHGRRFDHESELAVVIGRRASNVPRARAMDHVFGYSCLVDATMRIEKGLAEEERSMRKSFRSFTPMGPWIVTADEVPDPHRLSNQLWINGTLRQEATSADMIVGIAELIEMASSVVDLQPGDILATGTPEGVGPIEPGDRLRIRIEQVGEMDLAVTQAAAAPRTFGLPEGALHA